MGPASLERRICNLCLGILLLLLQGSNHRRKMILAEEDLTVDTKAEYSGKLSLNFR